MSSEPSSLRTYVCIKKLWNVYLETGESFLCALKGRRQMKNKKTLFITQSAMIAALYVAATYAANLLGLASGAVQLRISEALTVLPAFTFAAVPGLFIGCAAANLLTGCALWDVVFGSAATLIAAFGTYKFGKQLRVRHFSRLPRTRSLCLSCLGMFMVRKGRFRTFFSRCLPGS